MCVSWTRKGLISLMHGVTMKVKNSHLHLVCNYRILHIVSFVIRASMFSVCLYLYELYPPGSSCYQLSLPSTREFKKFSHGRHVVLRSTKNTASTHVHIVPGFITTCYFRIITYEPPSVSSASDTGASVRFY